MSEENTNKNNSSSDAADQPIDTSTGKGSGPRVDVSADYEKSKNYSVSSVDKANAGAKAAEAAVAPEQSSGSGEPTLTTESTGDPNDYRTMAKAVNPKAGEQATASPDKASETRRASEAEAGEAEATEGSTPEVSTPRFNDTNLASGGATGNPNDYRPMARETAAGPSDQSTSSEKVTRKAIENQLSGDQETEQTPDIGAEGDPNNYRSMARDTNPKL